MEQPAGAQGFPRSTSRTIHSSVASTTIAMRLRPGSRPAGFGTLNPWSAPGTTVERRRRSGNSSGPAHRVALPLDHQGRARRRRELVEPGLLRAGRAGAAGRPAPGTRRRRGRCAQRAADRAPAERPPTTSGVRAAQLVGGGAQASSRVAGAVATLRPATFHGCSSRTTVMPVARQVPSPAPSRSRVSMPPPAPWLSSRVATGLAGPVGDQPAVAVRRRSTLVRHRVRAHHAAPRRAGAARAAPGRCCGRC